jgi:hypothetical protein
MNNGLYVWVDKSKNLIITLPDLLPINWKNYNGLDLLDDEKLNELGWYDINNEKLLDYDYTDEWLSLFKRQLFDEVSDQRWKAQTRTVLYRNNIYDLDQGSVNALYQKRMIVQNDPSVTFYWKTRGNMIELTASDLIDLTTSIDTYIQECFNQEKNFIDNVSSLNTLEDLLQVSLNISWPSTTLK